MKTLYQCEKCGTQFETAIEAGTCESVPITGPIVKQGDKVRVTRDGKVIIATVSSVKVIDPEWTRKPIWDGSFYYADKLHYLFIGLEWTEPGVSCTTSVLSPDYEIVQQRAA